MIVHIPQNVNQQFYIICFENGNYMLFDEEFDIKAPMYTGLNRNYLESLLKKIKKSQSNAHKQKLLVYVIKDSQLAVDLQSGFYRIIPIKEKRG